MRTDLNKFLFVGMHNNKDSFFKKAQDLGVIDFIDSNKTSQKEIPTEIQHVIHAIKVLRGLPVTEQKEMNDYAQADKIAEKILEIKHHLDKLYEEERVLNLEISRVEVFGNFSTDDIKFIEQKGAKSLQFFCAKKGFSEKEDLPQEVICVGTDHGLDYFFTVNDENRQYDGMIEMKVDKPVGVLRENLKRVKAQIDEYEDVIKTYETYNDFLHQALIDKMNHHSLVAAQDSVQSEMNNSLFAVQGWVPVNKVSQLDDLVREFDVHYEEIAIEEEDRVPTCLQNEGAPRIGEDLVHIYDTPAMDDKDPSLWVLGFFSLFFAFIVGDGGYGFIFLAVALYLQFKFKSTKGAGKRFINLATILGVSCIVWGFLTTSFFGISFAPDSGMQKFSAVNWLVHKKVEYHVAQQDETFTSWSQQFPQIQQAASSQEVLEKAVIVKNGEKQFEMFNKFSDGIMLELALLVGMIHISLSFMRYLGRNWAGIGWIIFIIGGYFYFPYYLGTASMLHYVVGLSESTIGPNGLYLLVAGLSIAVFLSVVQNKLFGLLEVTTLVQVFGDILSYLRLYALGLAGGIVSATVNELAGSVVFVAGLVIIILGHVINIILSIMGGVIHGLRLNFLEWYHYCFEGGGKMFNPLRKLELD
ncbi:MAG: V-type ATPase 116kDa subunit family protein [Chlamydiota bacterium]|nr:V-type ATPase 116kDa subunit family protein [Chlamydiota bacterium]